MLILEVGKMLYPEALDLFEALKDGRKIIETRANSTKYWSLNIDQEIWFKSLATREILQKKIIKNPRFYQYFGDARRTIAHAYKKEDFQKIMPGVRSLEEVIKNYFAFPDYEQKVARFGLVVFEVG